MTWARGDGCGDLAALLATGHPVRAESDLRTSCIENRATLLVAGRLPSFEACSVAVPHDLPAGLERISTVVAAVSGGPHSRLAVEVAARMAERLDVPAGAVACHRGTDGAEGAESLVERITADHPAVTATTLELRNPGTLGASLDQDAVLVLGAPGGSWFQREIFGPGARLRAGAPGGAVVVRQSPDRVYQVMQAARAVGSHMRVRDAVELTSDAWVAVADHGRLAGLVSRSALLEARPHLDIGRIADAPRWIIPEATVATAVAVLSAHGGGPLPVADDDGRIHGTVAIDDVMAADPVADGDSQVH